MNVINYRVSLDMFDTLSQVTIKAKKGDSACKINITLTKNGRIFQIGKGCYATFNAKKSDGNFIYDACTIEGDTIVYDFTSSIDENGICQISACEGNVDCEVTLYNAEGAQLTSSRFTLYIDSVIYNGEEIVSSPQTDVLKELIKNVGAVLEESAVVERSYNPESKNAQSGTAVAEALGTLKPDVVELKNKSSYCVTPEMFSTIDEAISYCKTNKKTLLIDDYTLQKDTNFAGVKLHVEGIIHLNGFNLTLGGGVKGNENDEYRDPLTSSGFVNHDQHIENIFGDGEVHIMGCIGIKMYIGYYYGEKIYMDVNDINDRIAYSEFQFKHIVGIEFTCNTTRGWINENRFILNRVLTFVVPENLMGFSNNKIYGGCFEGVYNIEINAGHSNTFYDIRNEGGRNLNSKIYFGEKTRNNIIYSTEYARNVFDYGANNQIIEPSFYNARLISHDYVCTDDLVGGNNYTRFKNIALSDDGKYFKIVDNSYSVPLYTSPYITFDRSLKFLIEASLMYEQSPVVFSYSAYDKDLNKIEFEPKLSLCVNKTANNAFFESTEGYYVAANGYDANSGIKDSGTKRVSSEYTLVDFSSNGVVTEEHKQQLKNVKYIRLFISPYAYFKTQEAKFIYLDVKAYKAGFKNKPFDTDLITTT